METSFSIKVNFILASIPIQNPYSPSQIGPVALATGLQSFTCHHEFISEKSNQIQRRFGLIKLIDSLFPFV